jgi:hypothetical protein
LLYDDPVLALYDRLTRINDQVIAALEADVPGPELMDLLADHRAAMADLAKTEADYAPDAKTVPARLAGAKKLKAHVEAVQKKLEQKSRALVKQREKTHRTRQALDAYRQKK